jgi:hypothetical protein
MIAPKGCKVIITVTCIVSGRCHVMADALQLAAAGVSAGIDAQTRGCAEGV